MRKSPVVIRFIFAILAGLLNHLCHGETSISETEANFYISPKGSDSWSGTLATPNTDKTDGPFATITKARDAVRALDKKNLSEVKILVRGGRYQLNQTVVFSMADSGNDQLSISYSAYPDEIPIFSSGKTIQGFRKVEKELDNMHQAARGNLLVADVTDHFYTLYDNEGLLKRARSEGFIPLEGSSRDLIRFPEGKIKKWSNITDVEIFIRPLHAWIVNILPLASVDEKAQSATTSVESTYIMKELHFLKGTESCWVENILEELDQPGEWVVNTKEDKLYLWPRNDSPVLAAQLNELIRVEGDIDLMGTKDTPVKNLHFHGLTFMHGERYLLTNNDAGLQHDWDAFDKDNALIRLRGTENCSVKKCHFLHSGSGAIRVDLHGQNNELSSNHIEQMGGGGILLCGYGPGTKDVNKNNLVYNNHIHHVGRIHSHSPGIFIWQSGENRVANNLIHHTPYTALIISGYMNNFFHKKAGRELVRTLRRHELPEFKKEPTTDEVRPYLHTHDNLIEYNEIHHVMESLGDGNAIYIRGAGAGNIIRRNYIHHLVAPIIMQAAIRTDGGQMDTMIAENLIYKCTSQGIMIKLNNSCVNNFVIDIIGPPRGYYLSLREGPLTGASIKNNIFYSTQNIEEFVNELPPRNNKNGQSEDRRGRLLAQAKDTDADFNIYYCKESPEIGAHFLALHQSLGIDQNSKSDDPLFIDIENGNFELHPDSPAHAMGIIPIDLSKIGLR